MARYIGRHGNARVSKAVLVGALPTEVFGANRPGNKASQDMRDTFWLIGMQGSLKAELDCINQSSETDFTDDLKKMTIPTLVIHGDDDPIVPIANSSMLAAKLVKNGTVKVYAGVPQGLATTHKEQLNADLLAIPNGPVPQCWARRHGLLGIDLAVEERQHCPCPRPPLEQKQPMKPLKPQPLAMALATPSTGVFSTDNLTYNNLIHITQHQGLKGDLPPVVRIISPLHGRTVAQGKLRIGSGSVNGAGFLINREVVMRDKTRVKARRIAASATVRYLFLCEA